MNLKKAVAAIEQYGLCLTFPIDNSKATPSLWYHFHPKSKMRWEWDSGGDNRVAELWYLREELSRSKKVVYAKWFKGRATFFSKKMFVALLSHLNRNPAARMNWPAESQKLLSMLEENSPMSTKELKKEAELTGKYLEGIYTRSMKRLWEHLLIVGFGEVDDGAFPSLAVGSTENLFEELWKDAFSPAVKSYEKLLAPLFHEQPMVQKQVDRILKQDQASGSIKPSVDLSFFMKP